MTKEERPAISDGLEYNKEGYLVGPQASEMPVGLLTLFIGLLAPFFVLGIKQGPYQPWLLQKALTFKVAIAQGILSEFQVYETEVSLVLVVMLRFCAFPAFKAKYDKKYFGANPPPEKLRTAWLKQIRKLFVLWSSFIFLFLFIGGLFGRDTSTKMIVFSLFGLTGSVSLFAESVMSLALYAHFYFKFWIRS
jgi:hypothetical protein